MAYLEKISGISCNITTWENGKRGYIKDVENNYIYRFVECPDDDWDLHSGEENKQPIVAVGFIAWYLHHRGEDTAKMFNDYYNARLNQYKEKHRADADACERDLEDEFVDICIEQERGWGYATEPLKEYLSLADWQIIEQFTQKFFSFLANKTKSLVNGATKPQQAQPKQETTASTIPTINDTDKEKLVFGNALQKQYMSLNNGSYKWTLTKSLLAYMCGRLYCGDRIKEDNSDYSQKYIKGNTQMPAQEVKALFGVDVASNRYSIKAPPRNSWKVDELFKDKGASK